MDDLISAYGSLRALLEDLATRRRDLDADTLGAIRTYLALHCADCGAVISQTQRARGASRCAYCDNAVRAAIRRGMAGEDEVPF
jgi:hypothetical protein